MGGVTTSMAVVELSSILKVPDNSSIVLEILKQTPAVVEAVGKLSF
jgi:hypothetical protein